MVHGHGTVATATPPGGVAANRIGCGTSTRGDLFAAVCGSIVEFLVGEEP